MAAEAGVPGATELNSEQSAPLAVCDDASGSDLPSKTAQESAQLPDNESALGGETPSEIDVETEPLERAGQRLASHLDMLAETVRAIVTRVMKSPTPRETGLEAQVESATTQNKATDASTAVPPVPRTEYSVETRELCVAKHSAGASYKQIATELKMPVTSVQTIVQRARQQGGVVPPTQRTGRPRATDAIVENTIRAVVAEHPQWSARQVQDHVMATHEGITVSFETIRRRVRDCRHEMSSPSVVDTVLAIQDHELNAVDSGRVDPQEEEDTTSAEGGTTTPPSPTVASEGKGKARRKRGSEYSPEFREICVKKHEQDGQSYQAIATEFNVPPDSVRAIVRKAKRTGTVVTAPRSGRPRKTTELIDRVILQSVKHSQRSTAKQIQDDLSTIYQVKVSCETIRRRARDHTKQRLQTSESTAVQPVEPAPVPLPEEASTSTTSPSQPPKRPRASTTTTPTASVATGDVDVPTGSSLKRKRSEYSLETREKCVALYKQGFGYRKIGEDLKMPHTTVRAIVEKVQRTGVMGPAPRSGRPRKTDEVVDKVILQTVKTNAKCSARVIQQELASAFNVNVSCETIRRRVKDYMKQRHLGGEAAPTNTQPNANTRSSGDAISQPMMAHQYQQEQQLVMMDEPTSVSMPYAVQQPHLYHEGVLQCEAGHVPQSLMDMMTAAAAAAAAVSSDSHNMTFMNQPFLQPQLHPNTGMFGFSLQTHPMQPMLRHNVSGHHQHHQQMHPHQQYHQQQQQHLQHQHQHQYAPTSPPSINDFVL